MMTSEDPKIDALRLKIEDVKLAMQKNVERAIQRGEDLDHMEQKSKALEEDANRFLINARRVRRRMCWQSWKWVGLGILAVATLIGIIILIIKMQ